MFWTNFVIVLGYSKTNNAYEGVYYHKTIVYDGGVNKSRLSFGNYFSYCIIRSSLGVYW